MWSQGIIHAFTIGRAGLIHRAGYLTIAFSGEGIELRQQLIPAENPFCSLEEGYPAIRTSPGEQILNEIGLFERKTSLILSGTPVSFQSSYSTFTISRQQHRRK